MNTKDLVVWLLLNLATIGLLCARARRTAVWHLPLIALAGATLVLLVLHHADTVDPHTFERRLFTGVPNAFALVGGTLVLASRRLGAPVAAGTPPSRDELLGNLGAFIIGAVAALGVLYVLVFVGLLLFGGPMPVG